MQRRREEQHHSQPGGRTCNAPRSHGLRRILNAPAVNVALFAFLLNYPWEFLQAPLFRGMPTALHWEATLLCTGAALGDALLAVVAFWAVAGIAKRRTWILRPSIRQLVSFTGIGLAVTIVVERLATSVLGQWAYSDAMPVVPLLGVGLAPLLQWALLPPLVAWFVRRQLSPHFSCG